MLSKRYESTGVDRRTWLHVPSWTHWFTSSDTHQVVEIKKESPILGLAGAPIVETKFLELAMSLLDFSPRIPLGTFSIFLLLKCIHHFKSGFN